MKEKIKNTKILEKTVGPDKAQILKRLGFAPRSQSFAFVALPQYAQSVRYPDSLPLRPSANPQFRVTWRGSGVVFLVLQHPIRSFHFSLLTFHVEPLPELFGLSRE